MKLGKGAAERSAMIKGCSETWGKVMAGDFDENTNKVLIEYYGAMCEDIKALKKRIGGNWAIATVVLNTVVLQKMRFDQGEVHCSSCDCCYLYSLSMMFGLLYFYEN